MSILSISYTSCYNKQYDQEELNRDCIEKINQVDTSKYTDEDFLLCLFFHITVAIIFGLYSFSLVMIGWFINYLQYH